MSLLQVVLVPGEGVLLRATDGGRLPSDLALAARQVGGKRHGRAIVLEPAVAETLLTNLDADWEPAAHRAAENRRNIHAHAPKVLATAAELRSGGMAEIKERLVGCSLVDRLDDHQALNVALMTIPDGWGTCVFDEQGTGKTVSVVAAFDTLVERGEADRLLVVAPKSMIAEWATEFGRFVDDLYQVGVVDGSRRERLTIIDGRDDVLVLNYESVSTFLDRLVLLARRSRTILVVDESFNVKNPAAKRSEAVSVLREWCERAFVLCGTPAPHSAKDLVAQVNLVDLGFAFGDAAPADDPDTARREVRYALDRRGLYTRHLKRDVLPDLPRRRFTEIAVDLAPRQRALYDQVAGELVDDLRRTSDEEFHRHRSQFMQRRASLLRICSDPAPLDHGYAELPGKVAALDRLLDDLVVQKGEKVLLWSYYRATLDRLFTRYNTLGLVRIDGSVTLTAARREAVRRFQQDPDMHVFLGNPAAAGAGLTLHASRYAIYESLGGQAAHHMQSLDRLHRRGQYRDVEYVTLLARDTVEVKHYKSLLNKAQAQADLLGDHAEPRPTRLMLLDELISEARPQAGGSS